MKDRQVNQNYIYTKKGKIARGFLCILTFYAFMAVFSFVVNGLVSFDGILKKDTHYYETDLYRSNLSNEAYDLLNDIWVIHNFESEDRPFSVYDVSLNRNTSYDVEQMVKDHKNLGFEPNDFDEMEEYKLSADRKTINFSDFSKVKEFLSKEENENSYLYFDEKAFKQLFFDNGWKNTNYRFSDSFSEDAYFVFANIKKIGPGFTDYEDENLETRIIDTTDYDVSYDGNIIKISDISQKIQVDDLVYAVYDPTENIFYSTEDDYFPVYESYIYRTRYLDDFLQQSQQQYTNIVMPLLNAYNMSVVDVWDDIHNTYDNYHIAKKDMEGIAISYSIKNSKYQYANVNRVLTITDMEESYSIAGKAAGDKVSSGKKEIKNLPGYTPIKETLELFPSDTAFYFAFDSNNIKGKDTALAVGYREYQFSEKYIKAAIFFAIVLFVLIILQAAKLIITTGKTSKDAEVILLRKYDKLGTELWFLLSAMILVGSLFGALIVAQAIFDYHDFDMFRINIILSGLTVPFAIVFMLITLSFARRVKTHNLWDKLFIRRIYRYLKNKFVTFYYGRKGTERFLILFCLYIIVNVIDVLLCAGGHSVYGIVIFAIIQVWALLFVMQFVKDVDNVTNGVKEIKNGDLEYKCKLENNRSMFKELSDDINHIGDGLKQAVETSVKDERMKTDLITNVSHDLKTPLTSIINYIDLLKMEQMPTENATHYVEVLEGKAQRLKHLTEDLVEAAKANSGNIELELMPLAFDELMKQAIGEFEEKFSKRGLEIVANYPDKSAMIMGDGRRMFRIVENLLQNTYKYALEKSRVYVDVALHDKTVSLVMKNISAAPLNISADELMERFTRGDASRTTEGSGLGLSIAKDLTKLHGGTFEISLDGDLFKVTLTFPYHVA